MTNRRHWWQFWRPRARRIPDAFIPTAWAATVLRRQQLSNDAFARALTRDNEGLTGDAVKIARIGSIGTEDWEECDDVACCFMGRHRRRPAGWNCPCGVIHPGSIPCAEATGAPQ